jgi:hypothetical protein
VLDAEDEGFDCGEVFHVPGEGAVAAAWFLWTSVGCNLKQEHLAERTYDPVGNPFEADTHSPSQVSVALVRGSGSRTVNENVTLPPITFPMLRFEISNGGVVAAGAA